MNIYDFDNTVFRGDSGVQFVLFTLKKKPLLILKYFFLMIIPSFKYLLKIIDFNEYKSLLFSFVKEIKNLDEFVSLYVQKNKNRLKEFYKNQRNENDLIVSAAMDFYLLPLCKELDIKNVICTKYDLCNYKIIENNCHDIEKVNLVKKNEKYKNILFENAYSDSLCDKPLFTLAKKAFLVKGEKIITFEDKRGKVK